MSSHIVPLRTYFAIITALFVLTVITVAVASYDFGNLNTPVALAIALVKGFLVVAFFMHLKYSARILWLFAGAGLVGLVIMMAMLMTDYRSRAWQPHAEAWRTIPPHSAAALAQQPDHTSSHEAAPAAHHD